MAAEDRTADQPNTGARRKRALEALEGMRTMSARYPILDDRPTLEILREVRETDDSAPLRGRD